MKIRIESGKEVDVKVGDKVRYAGWIGPAKVAHVKACREDIKNGTPGFSLDDGHWCYADQVEAVL